MCSKPTVFMPGAPRNQGFSLIELLLVLGVIALLLVAAFVVYPRVVMSRQTNNEVTNLLAIRAAMHSTFGNRGFYASVSNDDMTQMANRARIFPVSMNGGDFSANKVSNVWGGDVTLTNTTSSHAGVQAGWSFVIRTRDVPPEACVNLVARTITSFRTIQVNYISGEAGENINRDNYDLASVTEKCNRRTVATVNFVD
jgi:hypothetical protein